jgi:ribosomal protein L34E
MTGAKRRSWKLRKVFRKTSKGKSRETYIRTKKTVANCGICGSALQGISTKRSLPKSGKRHGRPFAGALCGECTSEIMKLKTRVADKTMQPRDIELRYRKYVEQLG